MPVASRPPSLTVEEKRLMDKMKSFHLALKRKKDVPQRADTMRSDFHAVMELFKVFRRAERSRSQMFAFWDEYVRMVIMLLQFIKAEWTGNWCLHLEATSALAPYFLCTWPPKLCLVASGLLGRHGNAWAEASGCMQAVHGRRACNKLSKPTLCESLEWHGIGTMHRWRCPKDGKKCTFPNFGKGHIRRTTTYPSVSPHCLHHRRHGISADVEISWSINLWRDGGQVLRSSNKILSTRLSSSRCGLWPILATVYQSQGVEETWWSKCFRSKDPWGIHTSLEAVSQVHHKCQE